MPASDPDSNWSQTIGSEGPVPQGGPSNCSACILCGSVSQRVTLCGISIRLVTR